MTATNSDKTTGAENDVASGVRMVIVAPPELAGKTLAEKLFPGRDRHHPSPAQNTTKNRPGPSGESIILARPRLTLDDLSSLGQRELGFSMFSARADIALFIIDAGFGLEKRHLWVRHLACLAAIPHIIIAFDNMSSCSWSQERFRHLCELFDSHPPETECGQIHMVPVDFADNENIHKPSNRMKWHNGPAISPLLEELAAASPSPSWTGEAEHSDQFAIHLAWLSKTPMLPGRKYIMEHQGEHVGAHISALKYHYNPETHEHLAAKRLFAGNVGYGNLALETGIDFKPFQHHRKAGSFRLHNPETHELLAFGLIRHGLRRATNICWQELATDKQARSQLKSQKPLVLWFTGLSGSGKSTLANMVEKKLHASGKHTYLLDGDNVRHGLCRDLGFTETDRVENMRRIAETAKLFVDAGLIVLVSFISPFRADRTAARKLFDENEFIEIFVDTPLEICEQRDIKGLYKKARAGQLKNFTGIDSPYEPPENAEIILTGATTQLEEMVNIVCTKLQNTNLV